MTRRSAARSRRHGSCGGAKPRRSVFCLDAAHHLTGGTRVGGCAEGCVFVYVYLQGHFATWWWGLFVWRAKAVAVARSTHQPHSEMSPFQEGGGAEGSSTNPLASV